MQRTILTNRSTLLAALLRPLDLAAQAAQRHFVGMIVAMRRSREFFLPTTCHEPQANSGNHAIQVVPGTHSTCFLRWTVFPNYRIESGCKESDRNREAAFMRLQSPIMIVSNRESPTQPKSARHGAATGTQSGRRAGRRRDGAWRDCRAEVAWHMRISAATRVFPTDTLRVAGTSIRKPVYRSPVSNAIPNQADFPGTRVASTTSASIHCSRGSQSESPQEPIEFPCNDA